jgi:hypothetical protein
VHGGTGNFCTGVRTAGGGAVTLKRLDITVPGDNGSCIWIDDHMQGDCRISHCTLALTTHVVSNRHSGRSALEVQNDSHRLEIDHCLVTATPQWGITVRGNDTLGQDPDILVHHNRIVGTRARVANGYMLGIARARTEVFDNYLVGESRGILAGGVGDSDDEGVEIHHNHIEAQDQPNAEYSRYQVHGIKLESPRGANVHHNYIYCLSDADHCETRSFDYTLSEFGGPSTGNRCEHNLIKGISEQVGLGFAGWGINFYKAPNSPGLWDMVLENNVVVATDVFLHRNSGVDLGHTIGFNAFVLDESHGPGYGYDFEFFAQGAPDSSLGHRITDPYTDVDTTDVTAWSTANYATSREWTLQILVKNAAGDPVSGASVSVENAQAEEVLSGTTDANGIVEGLVKRYSLSDDPSLVDHGPFDVTVTDGSQSYTGQHQVDHMTVVEVDIDAETGATSTAAPAAPQNVKALRLAGERVLIAWDADPDPACIKAYLLSIDGELVAVTQDTHSMPAGLAPSTTYTASVQALGKNNLRSLPMDVTFTTLAEDRGP